MAALLHLVDQRRLIDSNGIADGATIAFYLSGTNTLATIYSDAGLATPRANPVVVGAGASVPNIYLDKDVAVRRVITYSDGSTDDVDPYTVLDLLEGAALTVLSFSTIAELLTSETTQGSAGDIWRAGPYSYRRAEAAATDHHMTTAGGVKLYVLPADGAATFSVEQFGGSTDNTAAENDTALQAMNAALISLGRHTTYTINFPANEGTFLYTWNRIYDGLTSVRLVWPRAYTQCTALADFRGNWEPFGPREAIFRQMGRLNPAEQYVLHTGHRFNTVARDQTVITMTTAGEEANYAVGDRVFIHGFCIQSIGYSPNLRYRQWTTVAAVGSGTITLTDPLRRDYSSNWPDHSVSDGGTYDGITYAQSFVGKPRIINLDGRVQHDGTEYWYPRLVELVTPKILRNPNAGSSDDALHFGGDVYRIIGGGESWDGEVALFPREGRTIDVENYSLPDGYVEIDKLIGSFRMRGGALGIDDNGRSTKSGSSCQFASFINVDCKGTHGATSETEYRVEGGRASSGFRADNQNQGPIMPGDASFFSDGACIVNGTIFNKLSLHQNFAALVVSQSVSITSVNSTTGALGLAWSASSNPPLNARWMLGEVVWLASDPKIRGRVLSHTDNAGVLEAVIGGPLGAAIRAGSVTAPVTIQRGGPSRAIIDGIDQEVESRFLAPNPGLLVLEDFSAGGLWTWNGLTISSAGTVGTADIAQFTSFPSKLRPGRVYRLTYSMTRTSGNVVITGSGIGTTLATLNTAGSNLTVDITPAGTDYAQTLQIRSDDANRFNGTFTPHRLVEL